VENVTDVSMESIVKHVLNVVTAAAFIIYASNNASFAIHVSITM
jgi:hypothetical protein